MLRDKLTLKTIWRDKKPELICGVMCTFAIISLAFILIRRHLYVETTYAVVQAYFIPLGPEVQGEITQVLVDENQSVKKGQVLCIIDDRPYLNSLNEAEARRDSLQPKVLAARKDLQRARQLAHEGAISPSQLDRSTADASSLESQWKAADAQASDARINVLRTRMVAPADGMISFRSARIGMYTTKGFPLFGFISDQKRWVEAKLRERDLTGFKIGDSVRVRLDAVPGKDFVGHVESVGAASEVPFAAIPDDFAAGNFTKYSQWIPVRVRLDLTPAEEHQIPIGINSGIRMDRRSVS